MAPKRSQLPLFLLLFLSISLLFLFSHFYSSLSPTSPTSPSSFSLQTSINPEFTITIKLLTFDRLPSLSRCLLSLSSADYGGDTVHLHIFFDHFNVPQNGSLDLDKKLKDSREILDFVDGFGWNFGQKLVHYRTANAGLQAQWLEAWWPTSDDEFAFVVEDDLEVSPLYYKFLKGLISNYYYNASNFSPSIYGASLQRPRFVPGKHGNKMLLDNESCLFLYQLVGTWGQLLFPRPWKEFRLWYDTHKAKGMKPILEGMVTTGWYKKMGERIWTPWFIKFIHAHGYFNLYTNFLHERALSISHRDAGVNYGKTAGPDSYLLDENSFDMNSLLMQPLNKLKWYDFCFTEVKPARLVMSFDELGSVLHSVQKLQTIVLVNLFGISEAVTRNLLCRFERLNVQNYIFLGSKSDFVLDLVRRGHPVIDADQMSESIKASTSMHFEASNMALINQVLVKSYVIKKSLEFGFKTWMLDGNVLPITNDSFSFIFDPACDFYVVTASKLLFVQSSSSALQTWVDDFIYELVRMVISESTKESFSADAEVFGFAVSKLLRKQGVNMRKIDDNSFNVNIDAGGVTRSSLEVGNKILFWSSKLGLDSIRRRLERLGMWIVDADLSCTAVICHSS